MCYMSVVVFTVPRLRWNERKYGIHKEERTEERRNGFNRKERVSVFGGCRIKSVQVLSDDDTENGENMPELQETFKKELAGLFFVYMFAGGMCGRILLLCYRLFCDKIGNR